LGVNRKATNVACRGELGKFPLLLTIKKNIINYFKHIYQLPDDRIAKQSLNISKDLYTNHKESYYSKAVNLLKPYYPNESNIELAILNTRSYYRKESAASPQGNKGSMHNLLNKRLFI
jgi:hypothetical protein